MNKIVAKDRAHLEKLIDREIKCNGPNCDLNYIDVSNMTNMSWMFQYDNFNGDISKWDVSNVTNMYGMFIDSLFNRDISNWNVSNVTNVSWMFDSMNFNEIIVFNNI